MISMIQVWVIELFTNLLFKAKRQAHKKKVKYRNQLDLLRRKTKNPDTRFVNFPNIRKFKIKTPLFRSNIVLTATSTAPL